MSAVSSEGSKTDVVPARQRKAMIGPIAANIAFVIELTLVPLLLPSMQLQFGLSVGALAWVFNAYGIAVALGVLLGGWFGDAFNVRKVFGIGVAFFAIGSLLVGVSLGFETLIVGRVLQGFGAGVFAPLVPLLLTQASPLRPGRVLIVWGSVAGYIAAIAPLFYGRVLGEQGWQLAFFLTALIAMIALIALTRSRMTDAEKAAPIAERNYADLFSAHDLWVTFLYVFCTYGAITYYLFRLPIWMADHGVTAATVGLILSALWLTFSGLSTMLRNLVDGSSIWVIMLAAPILIAAGLPLSSFHDNLIIVVISAICVGAGLACSNAPSTQLILHFAPQGLRAISTSLDITFARIGGILSVAILAEAKIVYASTAIGLLCVIAVLCALSASRKVVKAA